GEGADAGVRADGDCPGAVPAPRLGDEHRRRLVGAEPAVLLGDVDGEEAELAGLAEELRHEARLLRFDPLRAGDDLVLRELERAPVELALLVGETLRDEEPASTDRLEQ